MENQTYMTTEELAVRLRYDARYIRSALKDTVFLPENLSFLPTKSITLPEKLDHLA